jgi:hypothetical protein
MTSHINVEIPNSTAAEDVAIQTAFNNFITACRAATTHHVDCGGTFINGVQQNCDEAIPADSTLPPGTTF